METFMAGTLDKVGIDNLSTVARWTVDRITSLGYYGVPALDRSSIEVLEDGTVIEHVVIAHEAFPDVWLTFTDGRLTEWRDGSAGVLSMSTVNYVLHGAGGLDVARDIMSYTRWLDTF